MARWVLSLAVVVWVLAAGSVAQAAGVMLTLANGRYEHLRPPSGMAAGVAAVLAAERRFRNAGFLTDQGTDLSAAAMRTALDGLAAGIGRDRPQRVVLVFAGHVLHGDQGIWLMGTEARAPTLINVDAMGVRLETLLALAAEVQGGAIVAIADMGYPVAPGAGLRPGLPASVAVPQGVSLLRGPAPAVAAVLDAVAVPGTNLSQAVAGARGARLEGFDPPWLTFLPEGHEPAADPDRTAFAEAEALDTPEGWRGYLDDFPQGRFVDQARAALDRLDSTPERIEDRLGLTRDERRAVQRHLALLGFDPRGIDGIFGPGSRRAITGWQTREGLAATGFLDRDQMFRLAAQAARRAAEIEAEERERQAELERRDRAWWRDTGAGQDEAGLRAYLDRYPQGIFASIARERLAEIEARRAAEARARDRAAWAEAQARDTPDAYRAYLAAHPRGDFADQAQARIRELEAPEVTLPVPVEPEVETPAEIEQALNLSRVSLALIQQRLLLMGYPPGRIDGQFDSGTRSAIAAFQRDHGFDPTGYLTEDALNILIPGGLLRLLD